MKRQQKAGNVTDLHVIAGQYKGARLASPRNSMTHPMGAREKNALFNMLQPWIIGANVLDAYAGSGALGVEALSRGAASATFIEVYPAVVRTLRENLDRIGVDAEVIVDTVTNFAKQSGRRDEFDIIIADPPYDKFQIAEIVELHELLVPRGILALSYPEDLGELELDGFERLSTRRYAAAGIGIYQKN